MKMLNGSELAGFIKERQATQVRRLKQSQNIHPKLVILQEKDNSAINLYIKLKQNYGADIGVEVEVKKTVVGKTVGEIKKLNEDDLVHGMIVQLPIKDDTNIDHILNTVAPKKDVDGLSKQHVYDPATPTAILWLLAGYNVDLRGKEIVVVGEGRLVGKPLADMLVNSEYKVTSCNRKTQNLAQVIKNGDIVITATGNPGIITSDMIKRGAIVIDAGTASEGGKTVGDLADEVYTREDLTITPKKGGVGPLTVCALFENVLRAAQTIRK